MMSTNLSRTSNIGGCLHTTKFLMHSFSFLSEKEFDLKTALPPIKEKARSPDSLDGTFFVNESALTYSDGEKQQTYTELSSLPTRSLNLESLPPIGNRDILPPIRGQLVGRTGRLPPLHPPGHSQENLHELDEQSTTL